MPISKPAFFQSDRLPRWRSALTGGWIWLRMRFRHNPGYATATAAGTIGLILALALLLRGDWGLFGTESAEVSGAQGEPADLGEPAELPHDSHALAVNRLTATDSTDEGLPNERVTAGMGGGIRNSDRQRDRADWLGDDTAASETVQPVVVSKPKRTAAPMKRPRPSLDDDPVTAQGDLKPDAAAEAQPPALTSNEKPASQSKPRFTVFDPDANANRDDAQANDSEPNKPDDAAESPSGSSEPVLAEDSPKSDDRGAFLLSDDRSPPAATDAQPSNSSEPYRKKPAMRTPPVLADDEPTQGEVPPPSRRPATTVVAPESDAKPADEGTPATDDDGFVRPRPNRKGWNSSSLKADSPAKEPHEPATEEPVETQDVKPAAFADDESQSPADEEEDPIRRPNPPTSPRPTARPPRRESSEPREPRPPVEPAERPAPQQEQDQVVTLEMRYPRNVTPGQTFDLEFVVRNRSRSPVTGASLSVVLPRGLEHPLGPEVEQPIDSLGGCQVYRARLKVKARDAGDVSPRANVSQGGRIGAKCTATVRIGAPRSARSTGLDPCDCAPLRYIW